MIVDFHTHIFPAGMIAERQRYAAEEGWFSALYGDGRAPMAGADDLVREMDRCGIDHAVVSGFAWRSLKLCAESNDCVAEAVARHPERLTGLAVVPPLVAGAVAELERCLNMGLRGIGELQPEGQGFDLKDAGAMKPLARAAAEHGLPLLIHLNEPIGHEYPGKGSAGPKDGWQFARSFPELKIVYAHWGGGLPFYELMPEVRADLRNVWFDCAAGPWLYEPLLYRLAIDIVGAEKLLFGSDFPLLSPERYLKEIEQQDLDESERRAILGATALKLLDREAA